ncbi:hypothetical protein FD754_025222 [Muntiacus muntjak]|uniref:Uncharacterized protein n=1 Tax=Muntiacus muntjak TaxID=9888 RepID=A0A5N3UL46_MUNMU|nr:hypothetical protein FD754_025225 [Muntiacus muntjak]KAB0337370.1 hypothetical protein FD754_025224 [Muntiacus muntjak]KAB0337371.1 hypothetical protein FD754_025223 [Muntiacus muntjak]KAB0337372.1 hypothetical protein FD754_025222 [Muntiacus muntjak]
MIQSIRLFFETSTVHEYFVVNLVHVPPRCMETSHKPGLEKRSVLPVVKGILGGVLKGVKIFGKGASILTGLAEIVKKALKGQVMISGIQFDNHTQDELPTLQIEYSTLSEENKGLHFWHLREEGRALRFSS